MQSKRIFLKSAVLIGTLSLFATGVQAKSSLWKATSEKGTLYLQGSIHLLKATNYPLAPAIETAYAQSDVLVLEADMNAMVSPETQQLIMAKATLSGTETLEGTLSPEVYALLSTKLSEAGLPAITLQKFKPWFAAMTLMMTKMQAMGFDPSLGLDQYFFTKATTDGKPVIGLETVSFQIDLFDSLAEGNQDTYMKHTLKELELFETQLNELMASWETGDAETMGHLMHKNFKEYPELYNRFVLDRNKTWTQKIDAMTHKDKTHMIVVGVAHLPGKGGLIERLEKKGYTLEQL